MKLNLTEKHICLNIDIMQIITITLIFEDIYSIYSYHINMSNVHVLKICVSKKHHIKLQYLLNFHTA